MSRRAARAALALALALAAVAPGTAGAALVDRYADLGWRPDERPALPPVGNDPLVAPLRATAATYPLRGPTSVTVAPTGGILVTEAFAQRVVRLGPNGGVAVVPGRTPPRLPACAPQATGVQRVWADPVANQVFRSNGPGTRTLLAGSGRTGFAGDGGPAVAARLDRPTCAIRTADGSVLIADRGNGRVRRIAPDGTIATIAGDGTDMSPQELALLPDGAVLVSDPAHSRVLRVAPDGAVATVAGTGEPGSDGDGGPATRARLTMPWGLAVEANGAVVVSDFGSQTVRRISPAGTITTILGGPPRTAATASRALRATVPARRTVTWRLGSGDTGTSDESASGRRAVIRDRDPGGVVTAVRVVRGRRTFRWMVGGDVGCWDVARTATGLAGDERQGRDLQAAIGGRTPFAPGTGPYAPDLARGRLVVARRLVTIGGRPELGVPAWGSAWFAQRLVEWVIDRPSGRVVAVQTWAPWGLERRYRISPAHGPVVLPVTRPRARGRACGRSETARFAYGFRDGLALARRVRRRLEDVPALRIRIAGRRPGGARVSASAAVALERGTVREELLRVVAPGPPSLEFGTPMGSFTAMTRADGSTWWRLRGEGCWRGAEPGGLLAPDARGERPMPWEDTFFERPRRRGRLLLLRGYGAGRTVDSLVDPRDMRLVSQRWAAYDAGGRLTFREVPAIPPPPAPEPRCPARTAG